MDIRGLPCAAQLQVKTCAVMRPGTARRGPLALRALHTHCGPHISSAPYEHLYGIIILSGTLAPQLSSSQGLRVSCNWLR